jgi:hypothetical protein
LPVIDRVQMPAVAASVVLLLIVLELVRRRKLIEEYSFLWIISALVLLGFSMRRDIPAAAARWLGMSDPATIFAMLLIGMVFVASLCFSVIVSRQRQQIERLIEETAILSAELRDLRAAAIQADHPADAVQSAGPYVPAPNRRPM